MHSCECVSECRGPMGCGDHRESETAGETDEKKEESKREKSVLCGKIRSDFETGR